MKSLPLMLYWSLDRCPVCRSYADQWGEDGWVYDPRTARFIAFTIDRKNQSDGVIAEKTRAEFARDVLPGARAALREWFDSFSVYRTDTEELVLFRDTGKVARYRLEGVDEDAHGRPRYPVTRLPAEALRVQAPPALRAWLEAAMRSDCGSSRDIVSVLPPGAADVGPISQPPERTEDP